MTWEKLFMSCKYFIQWCVLINWISHQNPLHFSVKDSQLSPSPIVITSRQAAISYIVTIVTNSNGRFCPHDVCWMRSNWSWKHLIPLLKVEMSLYLSFSDLVWARRSAWHTAHDTLPMTHRPWHTTQASPRETCRRMMSKGQTEDDKVE